MSGKLVTMGSTGLPTPPKTILSGSTTQVRKNITERLLWLELARAIEVLGPQKAAQVVVAIFRLKGLPKEIRRHL